MVFMPYLHFPFFLTKSTPWLLKTFSHRARTEMCQIRVAKSYPVRIHISNIALFMRKTVFMCERVALATLGNNCVHCELKKKVGKPNELWQHLRNGDSLRNMKTCHNETCCNTPTWLPQSLDHTFWHWYTRDTITLFSHTHSPPSWTIIRNCLKLGHKMQKLNHHQTFKFSHGLIWLVWRILRAILIVWLKIMIREWWTVAEHAKSKTNFFSYGAFQANLKQRQRSQAILVLCGASCFLMLHFATQKEIGHA